MFSDGYEVTLKDDLGNLAEKAQFEYSGVSFDPEADKWELLRRLKPHTITATSIR